MKKNVISVLKTLCEDEKTRVFIQNYNKETATTTEGISYIPTAMAEVVGITTNSERFNVSVKAILPVLYEGEVKKVWRNYTIIRDGALNVKSIWAKPNGYYEDLKNAGVIKNEIDGIIEIDLTSLPLIDTTIADRTNPVTLGAKIMRDVDISATLKVIKAQIKEFKANTEESNTDSEFLTESRVSYDKEKVSVHCIAYDVPDYKGSNIEIKCSTLMEAENLKKALTDEQNKIRFEIRTATWALENGNGFEWATPLEKLARGNKMAQTMPITVNGTNFTLRRLVYDKAV